MSQSNIPLLHEVIPITDVLTAKLSGTIANPNVLPVVRTAAARGLKVLNKYYSATDESIMYCVAMSMYISFLVFMIAYSCT